MSSSTGRLRSIAIAVLTLALGGACSRAASDTTAPANEAGSVAQAGTLGSASGAGGAGSGTGTGGASLTPATTTGGAGGARGNIGPVSGSGASVDAGTGDAGGLGDGGGAAGGGSDAGSVEPTHLVVQGEPEPPFEPVALADLCPALAEALCAGQDVCGCGPSPNEPCVERATGECEMSILNEETRMHMDDGDTFYDPDAAGLFVATLQRLMTSCERRTPEFSLIEMVDKMGVLGGREPAGTFCGGWVGTFICLGYCEYVGDFVYQCGSDVSDGATCSRMGVCPYEAYPRLRCDGAPCREDFLLAPCTQPSECQSAQCVNGRCVNRAPLGAACRLEENCASLHCGDAGVCSEGRAPFGAACDVDQNCETRVCRAGTCAAGPCSIYARAWLPF